MISCEFGETALLSHVITISYIYIFIQIPTSIICSSSYINIRKYNYSNYITLFTNQWPWQVMLNIGVKRFLSWTEHWLKLQLCKSTFAVIWPYELWLWSRDVKGLMLTSTHRISQGMVKLVRIAVKLKAVILTLDDRVSLRQRTFTCSLTQR